MGSAKVTELSVRKTVYSRNRPSALQYLGKAQFQNDRLMRWALALQPYRFVIRAVKGGENVGADFLSRHTANSYD